MQQYNDKKCCKKCDSRVVCQRMTRLTVEIYIFIAVFRHEYWNCIVALLGIWYIFFSNDTAEVGPLVQNIGVH